MRQKISRGFAPRVHTLLIEVADRHSANAPLEQDSIFQKKRFNSVLYAVSNSHNMRY
ncbi:uncharacterized protein PHALS_00284 [Plasmopara halstedii]|uniref:Uncharacterized protein n=1 Tax=Plasmopara halstedii TaxID=4781 RepID=A0A0P1A786_PLAHL|nr:uncharacterized protein PHALS_00284 [Plasmopara halstedii]CEG35961.1 hypothetical protein PHALS_00284 [Plasmopara halstedii]|eukprot:XP_024572330.1 hypothetical protein PHALS_00284 [Plasmopara halstedii]